jgi:CDP-6-deoxy-D-xylo-4-hexulose-3-dehydrase
MYELKERILDLVKEYAEKKLAPLPYSEGGRIPYAERVFDSDEVVNLVDSALEFWLTAGRFTEEFEHSLAEYLGVKYVSFVNSGSSANLIAFMSLTSPLLGERAVKRGDEIITVAAGFPTTIAPIIQFGAIPVFVDITIPQYNIDVTQLERAMSVRTKAVVLAHTLGNPFNISSVKDFCGKYNLWLIEDNCDALGSEYTLEGKTRLTGTFGDIATSSFYPPHHITTGEGGSVYTSNPLLAKIIRSMRDWGRDCTCPSGTDNLCGHRFDGQFGELPRGYDHKYIYSHFGYNLKATDMQAAIGVSQLKKLPHFIAARRRNFNYLRAVFNDLQDEIVLPDAAENSNPSWFGFPILCRKDGFRDKTVEYLERNGIQTRMLFAGNIVRQPCMKGVEYRVAGKLDSTDNVMNNLFWLGIHPGLDNARLDKIACVVKQVIA